MKLRPWLLAATLLCVEAPLWAAEEPVALNFANVEVSSVLRLASQLTGKQFVIDPRVRGNISVVSAEPLPRELVYPTLVAALRLQGIAAIDDGRTVRIVPEAEARSQGAPLVGKPPAGDSLATQVFNLRHESAVALSLAIKPLLNANATAVGYPGNNTLVVTDFSDNLRRIGKVLQAIDVPSVDEPQIVPLRYASASELAGLLQSLVAEGAAGAAAGAGAGAGGERFTVLAEPRSNSLLLKGNSPGKLQRARQLIQQLDQPEAGGNIEVIYLRNAVAAEVAQTLRALLSADGGAPGNGATAAGATAAPNGGGFAAGLGSGVQGGGALTGSSRSASSGATPAGNAGAAGGAIFAASQPSSGLAQGSYIQADAANNALIISAPPIISQRLKKVVAKLDLRRTQIYVEALIAEVNSDTAAQFGIQWQSLGGAAAGATGTHVVGSASFNAPASGFNIAGTAQNPLTMGNGLNVGISRGTITLPNGTVINNLLALASFLESNNNANILSTPTLMTLDNQEAQIQIGQDIPVITGSYSQTSGSATPFQTYDRRKVGLGLRILPQVTEGGTVRMKIMQEASTVVPGTLANPSGPTINTRTIETAVQVEDGGLLVLGGLIQDTSSDGVSKVPVIGDLPLVGNLFRYTTRQRSKTNLLVFLRPRTLRSAEADQQLSSERYDYIAGAQRRMNGPSGDAAAPVLPPLTPPQPQPQPQPQPAPGAGGSPAP